MDGFPDANLAEVEQRVLRALEGRTIPSTALLETRQGIGGLQLDPGWQ
jgi:hypothetical protein